MAEYTDLSTSDIERLFHQFHDRPIRSSQRLSGGRANSSYLVETHSDQFVMTVCDAKNQQECERAARLLELMSTAGLPTPQIFRSHSGEAVVLYEGRPVTLKKFQPGKVHPNLSEFHLGLVGDALARLHGLTPPSDLGNQFSYGLQTFADVIGWSGSKGFGRWLQAKFQTLSHLDDSTLPCGLIHGDLFWDNIVVTGDTITLLDFEEACHYTLAFDLGMSLVGCCFCSDQGWQSRVRALLDGYQAHRELEPEELRSLQSYAVYGATATACWRFWQYNMNLPDSPERDAYREMQELADRIAAVDATEFRSCIQ